MYEVTCANFTSDENYLLIGLATGEVIIWDTNKSVQTHRFVAHEDVVITICPFLDNQHFMTIGHAENVAIWDINDASRVSFSEMESYQPIAGSITLDQKRLIITNYADPNLVILDISMKQIIEQINFECDLPKSIILREKPIEVTIGCQHGMIVTLSLSPLFAQQSYRLDGVSGLVLLDWSPINQQYLGYEFEGDSISLFALENFDERYRINIAPHNATCASFHKNSQEIIVGIVDGLLLRINIEDYSLKTLNSESKAIISPLVCSEHYIFAGDSNGDGLLWNSPSSFKDEFHLISKIRTQFR